MRPSLRLARKRGEALAILTRGGAANARLFGSVARGTDREGSDIDILVDAPPARLGRLGGLSELREELETLLGVHVDLTSPGNLRDDVRRRALAEARFLTPDLPLPATPEPNAAAEEARMNEIRLDGYLDQIRQAAREAVDLVQDMEKTAFTADKRTQLAVAMCFIRTGEAAAKIMNRFPDFAASRPDIPWRDTRDARNKFSHDYDSIDFDMLWEMIQTDLPVLLDRLGR